MADDPNTEPAGQDLPIHRSSLPEAKWLNDLYSIYRDLEQIKEYLLILIQENPHPSKRPAFFAAALIAYRRCFTTSLRKALSHDDVADSPNNAGWLHKELLDQADKLIAHSINPFEETMSGFMVNDDEIAGVVTLSAQLVQFHPDQTKQWGRLIEEIQNKVVGPKINAARAALLEAGQKLPIDQIKRAPLLEKNPFTPRADQKRES